jgi:Glycosyltransferase family 87
MGSQTSPSDRPKASLFRVILVGAGLVLAGVLLIQQLGRLLADRTIMPPDDFVEYWAAGRLNAHGQNPYDGALLLPLEQEAGRDTELPVMMWNPPWTLTFVMPLGLFDARLGQLVWLLLNLGVIIFCADWTWQYYQGPSAYRWLAWALAFTYVPTMMVLRAGQIGPLILLGIVGFLHYEKKGQLFWAGAACVLIAIKPHLLFLFWIALALWAVQRQRWSVLIGGFATGLIATAIPLFCNPDVCQQYWYALTHHPPEEWISLTLGSILRLLFGENQFWLQIVPAIPAVIWFAFYWRKHHGNWQWGEQMPLLTLVSFLTTFYGAWPFDLVILLLPVVQAAVWAANERRLRIPALIIYLGIDILALVLNLAGVTSIWFIWMTPALLAAYLSLRALKS